MNPVNINLDELEETRKLFAPGDPVVMVNLLRYRETSEYGAVSPAPFRTGRDAYYKGYCSAVFPLIRSLGGDVHWFGNVRKSLFAAAEDQWDDVLLVRYPSFDAVLGLLELDDYQKALFHRVAALDDTKVMACSSAEPGF